MKEHLQNKQQFFGCHMSKTTWMGQYQKKNIHYAFSKTITAWLTKNSTFFFFINLATVYWSQYFQLYNHKTSLHLAIPSF